jgi:hypothetical protein
MKPKFAATLTEILRPGKVVHGLTASPMKIAAVNVVGFDVAVVGMSEGKEAVHKFRATSSLVHRLAFENHRGIQRLASIVLIAGDGKFGMYVNESIRAHGLPTDPKMNWDAYINAVYRNVAGANPDMREDAIYYVIVTNLYNRDYLARFNPAQSPLPADAPLEEKVTAFLKQMFRMRVSEAVEYCQSQFVMDRNQAEKYDVTPGGYSLDSGNEGDTDYSQHHTLVNDNAHTDQEIAMELREFRTKFQQWLSKKKGPTEAELMLKLFDASLSIGDRDFSELQKRWEVIAPGKSVSYMSKLLRQLGELLEDFAATGQVPGFEQLIKRQKQRTQKASAEVGNDNAEVHVPGYGVMSLGSVKRKIQDYARAIANEAAKNNYTGIAHYAYGNGVLKAMIETVQAAEKN